MSPNTYDICGLTIKSELPIPLLLPSDGPKPDYEFKLLTSARAPACRWKHHFKLPDGRPWMSVAGLPSDFHLSFPKLAHFSVSAAAKEICCYCKSEISPVTLLHLFLDLLMPLILSQQEKLVLHAGAVMISGKVIAFIGGTGQGKSSITASFGQKGFPVVADDCLVIEDKGRHRICTPLYPGLRLWPDAVFELFGGDLILPAVAHYTEKRRLGPDTGLLDFCREPGPLEHMYVLSTRPERKYGQAVTIDPLSPREALMELVKHPYRLGLNPRQRLKHEFEAIGRLANSLAVSRLYYSRDYALLPEVHGAILADLDQD